MIRRLLLTTAAAMVLMALSTVARADSIVITGIHGTGVTATISDYTLTETNGVLKFQFTITNTSVAPGSTGTITNIGFNLPGDRNNDFKLVTPSDPDYHIVYDLNATAGSGPLVNGDFDIVLSNKDKGKETFGGGKVAAGIAGGTSATFTITGDFKGLTADEIARAIFARFQEVNGGDSDVAGNPNAPIPEPMTMLLFGTGLAGVAARVRRRRQGAKE